MTKHIIDMDPQEDKAGPLAMFLVWFVLLPATVAFAYLVLIPWALGLGLALFST